MATGADPSAVPSGQDFRELGKDDLKVVFNALIPVAQKYEFLGIEIGLDMDEIDGIQRRCTDCRQCLLRTLDTRLRQTPALTWNDIDTALRSKAVNESKLANTIKIEYGHLFGHEQTSESQEDGRKGSEKKHKSTKKGNYTVQDHPQQVRMEQETDEEVSESGRFKKSSETDDKSTKTQRRVKKAKKHSEPEQGNVKCERKAQMKQQARHEAKIESKVRHKSSHTGTCKEQIAPKEVQAKSESESSASSSKEEMEEVGESETAEEYSSKQEIVSDHQEVRKSDNISTKTQRRVKKAKKHSEPEQGNAKRERKGQMKQQARHEAKIESKVRHKGSHTGTCKEQIAPKEVQAKSESESSVSSSKEEIVEVGESETAEEYSSEQEQDSDKEEVSEDPTTSESEVTKETKGFVCPATEKQKKVINQQYIQTSDRGDRRKSGAQKRKSRKKQRAESEIRCNVPDEIVTSSSHYGGKASQTVEKTNPSKQIQGKEDERRETKTYKINQRAQITEEFSDEEVREKPATKSAKRKEHKKLKTKEKSTNTGKERNEDEKVARIKIIKTEYHLKTKENVSLSPDTHVKEQKEKDKRSTKVRKETDETKDLKADSGQKLTTKRKAKNPLPSDVTEEDSEGEKASESDEEWYSAESSEGNEDRESEQKSSDEEEEREPSDDESAGATSSKEEVSEELKPYMKENVKETKRKVTRKGKKKIAKLPGDNDPENMGENREERDVSPKKRSRRRQGRQSMSPIARGSSSPSTSQEEHQTSKEQGKKTGKEKGNKKKKEKGKKTKEEESDSSPECDRLSENEKPRTNVFERFYGQLCCEISNPVEIAAQLQKKGLISKAMMKDLIQSPESIQSKTICLVDELDIKMSTQPDCLFTFIEVLLENDTLNRVGRELLREAGSVCPERTQAKFPSQVLSSDPLASSLETPGKESTNTAVNRGDRTSQGVSLSLPQSVGLSPVLAKYKQYLQSVYNARVLAPADKYLPTLEASYINLAMIRRGRYNPEQRDEFTRQTLHGGVDQILESKTPINIEDLLTPEEGGRPVRFILVEGPPGIGKSTFAWEVCRRWDEIQSLRDYHTVVLLKLREKWVLNATSLSDLLRYPSHPDFSKSIAEELVNVQGRNLLLILDGFDEVSHSFHENSVIKSILCRQLLPECTIILTTRPVAKATLESICQPRVDKHVEIIGFTEEERVRYITEVFSKEPELQVNFLKYMFLVPHIKSMMYIPLNCAIIAQVYYESQSSRYVAIPRTRTQLYKALTHSLLVRHMKMKNSDFDSEPMLPEGLDNEHREKFKSLAKFAFDIYHKGSAAYINRRHYLIHPNSHQTGSRKVTFFKEDIPEGLVHFGFMNESTEMYAGKGVERTFSFLHLSLQEYLAAWHLANSSSIEFQVAYHRLAVDGYVEYKGDNKEEEALISSLRYHMSSLKEPAIFLAGITGWRCQSESDRNHWEMYLSHDTARVRHNSMLLRSLYEAQNPTLVPLYFASNSRRDVGIGSGVVGLSGPKTPYDCYALSFCLANSSEEYGFSLSFVFNRDYDISLVETFVKGLNDHCKSTTPLRLRISRSSQPSLVDRGLLWLVRASLLNTKECLLHPTIINSSVAHQFLQTLANLQSLNVSSHIRSDLRFGSPITSWEWLGGIKSLSELKHLHISSIGKCSPPPTDIHTWPLEHGLVEGDNKLREVVFHIEFPSITIYDIHSPTDVLVDSVLKSVLRSNTITKLVLPNISRGTMVGVHSILLHCPSLTKLGLLRTTLGYDGILYICSALRNNTTLTRLVIYDTLQLPKAFNLQFTTFSSVERVPLPSKTTPTDFLLELNNILKDNTTLKEMKIQSGLFLPLSVSAGGYEKYCQWTGLGPLQQFNVGAVASGMSPNLRRSFSLSDLTQPQTQLFWDRNPYYDYGGNAEVDFKKLFSKRKEKGNMLFSGPSFTASDTPVLQSFSGLDPRLKKCLEIIDLRQYAGRHFGEVFKYNYGNS